MSGVLHRARFRLDHRWTPNHMSAYVDAELARGERGRMERHLDECGECRRLLAGLRATLDVLHRLPAPSGGAGTLQLVSAVRARLREPPAS